MANDFSKFFARDNTEFTTEFWNRFLKEADNRIKPVESRLISYDETLTLLKGLTLELLQNAISSSLAVVEEQTKLVALMNFFVDGQTRTMGQGSVTFTLDPEEAAQITDAGYVTVVPNGSPSFRMTGPITDLDAETGEITINVVAVDGAGTFEEWFIGVGFIAAGQEGVNFRGAYDAEATYYKHDAVYFAGTRSSYIATADEPAAAPPSAGWALLAEGGTDGEDGTDGSDGIFSEIADQAEAEAGEDNTKGMTPLRTKEAITALVPKTGFVNLGEVSGAVALDMSAGLVFRFTPTGDVTISVTNVPAGSSRIQVLVDDAGAHSITWPVSFTWDAGSEPTLPASGRTTVDVFTADGGTAWTAFYPVSGLDINGLTDGWTAADDEDEMVFYDVSEGANKKGNIAGVIGRAIYASGNLSYPGGSDSVVVIDGSGTVARKMSIQEFFRQTIGSFKNKTDFIPTGPFASYDVNFIQNIAYPRTITLTIHDVTVASSGQLRLAFSDDNGSTFCTAVPVGPTITSGQTGQYFVIITQSEEDSGRGYALVQVWSLEGGMTDLNSYVVTNYDQFIVNTDFTGVDEMRVSHSGGNINVLKIRQHTWA